MMKKLCCVMLAVLMLFSCSQALAWDLYAGYEGQLSLEVNRDALMQMMGFPSGGREADAVMEAVVSMLNHLTVDVRMDENQNALLDMKLHEKPFLSMQYETVPKQHTLMTIDAIPDAVLVMPAMTAAVPGYDYDATMVLWQKTLEDCGNIFLQGLSTFDGAAVTEEACEKEIQGKTFNHVTTCEMTGTQLKNHLDKMLSAMDQPLTAYYETMGMADSWAMAKGQYRQIFMFPEELKEVPVLAQVYRVQNEEGFVPGSIAGDMLLMAEEKVHLRYFVDGGNMDFLLEGNGMVEYRALEEMASQSSNGESEIYRINFVLEDEIEDNATYTVVMNPQTEAGQQVNPVGVIEISTDDLQQENADAYRELIPAKMPFSYHVYGKVPTLEHMDLQVDITQDGAFAGVGMQMEMKEESAAFRIGLSMNEDAQEPLMTLKMNLKPWCGSLDVIDTEGKLMLDLLNMDRQTQEQFDRMAAQAGPALLIRLITAAPEEMQVLMGSLMAQ